MAAKRIAPSTGWDRAATTTLVRQTRRSRSATTPEGSRNGSYRLFIPDLLFSDGLSHDAYTQSITQDVLAAEVANVNDDVPDGTVPMVH